jgi:hypothetical protein
MTAVGIETIPTAWDDERDSTFFRLVESLFTPAFTHGADVLLASYDDVHCQPAVQVRRPAPHNQRSER